MHLTSTKGAPRTPLFHRTRVPRLTHTPKQVSAEGASSRTAPPTQPRGCAKTGRPPFHAGRPTWDHRLCSTRSAPAASHSSTPADVHGSLKCRWPHSGTTPTVIPITPCSSPVLNTGAWWQGSVGSPHRADGDDEGPLYCPRPDAPQHAGGASGQGWGILVKFLVKI